MKTTNVPQDQVSTYAGQNKLFYAVDENGEYTGVKSSGWEVESEATKDAVKKMEDDCLDAWQRAKNGEASPLEFHMYRHRMDLILLSQTAGMFQWRVKRHFDARRFQQLPTKIINRYCDALGITPVELQSLPTHYPN